MISENLVSPEDGKENKPTIDNETSIIDPERDEFHVDEAYNQETARTNRHTSDGSGNYSNDKGSNTNNNGHNSTSKDVILNGDKDKNNIDSDNEDDIREFNSFLERKAIFVARNPRMCFWTALTVAMSLSVFGMIFGEFSLQVSSEGWATRGTIISKRNTQSMLVRIHQERLFSGDEEDWVDLTENIQPSWEDEIQSMITDDRRQRRGLEETNQMHPRLLPFKMNDDLFRRLQHTNTSSSDLLEGCDFSVYTDTTLSKRPGCGQCGNLKAKKSVFWSRQRFAIYALQKRKRNEFWNKMGSALGAIMGVFHHTA